MGFVYVVGANIHYNCNCKEKTWRNIKNNSFVFLGWFLKKYVKFFENGDEVIQHFIRRKMQKVQQAKCLNTAYVPLLLHGAIQFNICKIK